MKYMLVALLTLSLASCKKIKEDIQEKKVLNFITSGQWKVSKFEKGSADNTAYFAGYQFQFKSTEVVDAIKNGTVEKSGSWHPDATNYTITSKFPGDAAYPLPLLNGTWQIVDGGDNYVVATQTVNGELYKLQLDKV